MNNGYINFKKTPDELEKKMKKNGAGIEKLKERKRDRRMSEEVSLI